MISVVVPVYNVEKFLPECINSILRQTYTDLDIILVDDGSTDKSGEICESYAQQDSRIRVYHKENGGLSDARNYGIKKALGSEITFVDSDDMISDHMIQSLYENKVKYSAQMSVCFRRKISEDGIFIDEDVNYSVDVFSSNTKEDTFKVYFESKGGGYVVWGKLYDIDLYNDIEFPVGKYNEDTYTIYKVLAKCQRIVVFSEKLYYYRIRTGSIVNSSFKPKHLDAIYSALEVTNYIEKNYPTLSIYPQRLLYYSTLKVAIMMIKSRSYNDTAIKLIKGVLEDYRFLLSTNLLSYKAKLLAFILLNIPRKAYYIISKF